MMRNYAMIRFLVAVGMATSPIAAHAQSFIETVAGLKFCKSVKDDALRLKCFDGIEVGASLAAPSVPKADVEIEWDVKDEKSPLDDSPQITAILSASEGGGSLVLRCKEKKTEAIFSPGRFSFLGSGERIKVLARIGDGKLIETQWTPSTTGTGTFAPSPIQFMRALPDDGKLFLRAFAYNGSPSDSTFKLGKVSAMLDKIAAACSRPKPK